MGDRLDLQLGIADPARDHRAAERVRARLEDEAAGREMIGERVVYDVAGTEAGGEQRARRAIPVVRRTFRLEDRPRRHEQPADLAGRRDIEPAERRVLFLQRRDVRFAHHRQLGKRFARGDGMRIDAGKVPGPARRGHGVRHDFRHHREFFAVAQRAAPGFEGVVVVGHLLSGAFGTRAERANPESRAVRRFFLVALDSGLAASRRPGMTDATPAISSCAGNACRRGSSCAARRKRRGRIP